MALPDVLFLRHMLSAIDRIVEVTARTNADEFAADWVLQDAVMRELEILGEAAGRVSMGFVAGHPAIPWREMSGLRHKLIHDYFVIDRRYNPRRSQFWAATRRLIEREEAVPKWYDHLVWSNLHKIAPGVGGNPGWGLSTAQFPFALELLRREVSFSLASIPGQRGGEQQDKLNYSPVHRNGVGPALSLRVLDLPRAPRIVLAL